MDSEAKPTFSKSTGLPRKRFYRARAHSNPLSDSHFPIPISPAHVDFSLHFPKFVGANNEISKKIEFADIGCGFGGLLISLATLFPDTLMIGMELRDKVTEYVKERILALRRTSSGGQYENISVVRTNSMKYIPNYFEKGQLSKMFFLFPDPHFKEKNHRRRVISTDLLDEYAYVLRAGGIIYTITDVEELGEWMRSCLEKHPMFESLTQEELDSDPVVELLCNATEEGQKVARNGGQTFRAVFRRIAWMDHPQALCKLNKAIYGLKQAPRMWYNELRQFLLHLGFSNSLADASLFIYNRNGTLLYMLVYVDDILLTGNNQHHLDTSSNLYLNASL